MATDTQPQVTGRPTDTAARVPTQPHSADLSMTGLHTALKDHPIAPAIRVSRNEDAPRLRHLVAASVWAALLGVVGLAIGLRGFVGVLAGDAASWYEPTIITLGVVGIGLTVGGFATIHRHRAPWVLLGAASVTLLAGLVSTISAF
ncbi:hypothetical protein GCM10009682_41860 [Luedemannella flava]|uniref:Uncharacterized protein n=1 Tax=Luedemannella flava TaxID=349316 RepID=A0ABN2M9W8_9ACTN